MTAVPPDDEPVLVVPSSLVVPDAARARLRRQYDHRPPGAVGIATRVASVAPGSSTTTTAERAAMAPLGAAVAVRDNEIHGAVLLQPGVEHVLTDRTVTVQLAPTTAPPGLHLLVDPGACAFDPRTIGSGVEGAEGAATPEPTARPPFRWRPVVLFLASASGPDRAAAAVRLAEALAPLEVEPRLALHDPVSGPVPTTPCSPTAPTVAALEPDVIVALDDGALAMAEDWSAGLRHTVLVALDPDVGDGIELVPWTIDRARGRLRARIGDRPEPEAVARLVNRLCSGPVPGAPVDGGTDGDPGAEGTTSTSVQLSARDRHDGEAEPADDETPATRPRFALGTSGRASPMIVGLGDHLEARGHERERDADGPRVDLLLLDAELDDAGQIAIVDPDQRAPRAARRVLVVDRSDDPPPPPPGGPRRRLDDTAGAIATDPAWAEHLRSLGLATIVLPHLRPRGELDGFEQAHRTRIRPATTTVGLLASATGAAAATTATRDAALAAFDELRGIDGEAALVLVQPEDQAADPPFRPGCTTRRSLPPPADLVGWAQALWVPADPSRITGTELGDLVSLALAGVPVIMPAAATRAAGSVADPTLAVDDPASAAAWTARLVELHDDDRRERAATRARRIGAGRAGFDAAALVVERLLGWVEVVAP